ncbi:MAG TPA: TonB-dependent receptor, partial [Beijerinckiaceae bacterium]
RRAAYVFNELAFAPTWRLQAAARLEHVRVGGVASLFPADFLPPIPFVDPATEARTRGFTPASFSLGLLKELPYGVVASLTAQRVERAPEALELFARGAHEASGTFEIGDPNLRKEEARSIEFGLRRARGDLRFDFSAFHTRYRGFISKRLTGVLCGEDFESCGVEDELRQIVFTQRDATFTGAELAVQYDLMTLGRGLLGVDGQFDVVRARFAGGQNVPRIPPMRLGGGVFWRSDAWFARVGLLHAFEQNRIKPDEETPTRGYDLLKAELSYRFKSPTVWGAMETTIGLVGTNLLNDDVRNHVSFKKDEVLQPGRGVRLFANVKF